MQAVDSQEKFIDREIVKKVLIYLFFLFLLIAPALSYASSGVNTPSYWIKKLKSPDEIVLARDEIGALNRMTLDKIDQMADIGSMPDYISGERVFVWLWVEFLLNPGARYDSKGRRITDEFYDGIAYNMNLEDLDEMKEVRFGVVVDRADIRALPTDEAMLSKPGRDEFDTIQYTSVYAPEEVALLHTSRDGQWGFFQTPALRGWMRLENVAFGDRELTGPGSEFIVVTASKLKVFSDKGMKETLGTVPMGSVLSLSGEGQGAGKSPWAVRFPQKDGDGRLVWVEGYISRKADVNQGYLPYTRRNVIKQAFKMLGEGYGWGGRDGKRDCSLFIKDLFSTMGMRLPRNSRQQGATGDVKARIEDFDSRADLKKALMNSDPGITLITINGHIMLHIGAVKGKPYVIHQIFGYKDGRRMKVINKVAVTGLDLGKRSRSGSFKNRLRSITELTIPVDYRALIRTGSNA